MHKAADEVDRNRRRRWGACILQRRHVARTEWEHTNCSIFMGGRSVGSVATVSHAPVRFDDATSPNFLRLDPPQEGIFDGAPKR